MDAERFDDLARALGGARNRRQLLKALVGSTAGGLLARAGARPAAADTACKPAAPAPQSKCTKDGQCCAGLVCEGGRCQGGCRIGGAFYEAGASNPANQCQTCQPSVSTSAFTSKADGTGCDDGNACTRTDTCQSGTCVGGDPVVCTTLDQCHVAGACDPRTGTCSNPNAPDGTGCSDGDGCTTCDACVAGVCVGAPVECPAPRPCEERVACDPAVGACVAVARPDGALCGADRPCSRDVCQSGRCVADVPKPAGTACNDANACTQTDACDGQGTCVGGAPVTCTATDACHEAGVCDPDSGRCGAGALRLGFCFVDGLCHPAGVINPDNPCQVCDPVRAQDAFSNRRDGDPCHDGDLCTVNDTCQNGACVAGTAKACPAPDACHGPGVCQPATGECVYPDLANGTSCSDGDACTQGDTCQDGVCRGTASATNDCAGKGIGDACGSACNRCVPEGQGICVPGSNTVVGPLECAPVEGGVTCDDPCKMCDPATGLCTANRPDATNCQLPDGEVGTCQGGTCTRMYTACGECDLCYGCNTDNNVCEPICDPLSDAPVCCVIGNNGGLACATDLIDCARMGGTPGPGSGGGGGF